MRITTCSPFWCQLNLPSCRPAHIKAEPAKQPMGKDQRSHAYPELPAPAYWCWTWSLNHVGWVFGMFLSGSSSLFVSLNYSEIDIVGRNNLRVCLFWIATGSSTKVCTDSFTVVADKPLQCPAGGHWSWMQFGLVDAWSETMHEKTLALAGRHHECRIKTLQLFLAAVHQISTRLDHFAEYRASNTHHNVNARKSFHLKSECKRQNQHDVISQVGALVRSDTCWGTLKQKQPQSQGMRSQYERWKPNSPRQHPFLALQSPSKRKSNTFNK